MARLHWLVGWLVALVGCIGWLHWLVALVGCIGWLHWLVALVGWLVGWLVGRSVGRSVGWLVGWLVGWVGEWVGEWVGGLVACLDYFPCSLSLSKADSSAWWVFCLVWLAGGLIAGVVTQQ